MKTTNLRWVTRNMDYLRVPLNGTERADMQGDIPYWGANGVVDYVNDFVLDERVVLVGEDGAPFFDCHKDVSFIAEGKAWINNHIHIIKPDENILCDKYLVYFLNQLDYSRYINGSTRDKLTQTQLGNISVSYPDIADQRKISDFLDRETSRIDLLIDKKSRLIDLVSSRFEALIASARDIGSWQRFGFCAASVQRSIPILSDESFCPLGLYNRGRGFFKKSESEVHELGDSSFFFVKEGDLVLSGQFAWEGAVGLVSHEEDGCIVSHRYPVYVGRDGVLSEYLFAYFRSHHGRFLMDNCSRGAAGRNRPLNARILEKEKIPIPSLHLQRDIREKVHFEKRLKSKVIPSIDRLKEYRFALITAAVNGQIDVSTWDKAGTSDRQLDAILSEFAA